jgi:hypothetical protein
MGIVERAMQPFIKSLMNPRDDDRVVGSGAGLGQFFHPFVNDGEGPRAKKIRFQGMNREKVDPYLRTQK